MEGAGFNLAPVFMQTANLTELSISLLLQIWLIAVLLRRTWRQFPVFCIFVILEALAIGARLGTLWHYRAYFYAYWYTEAVVLPLSLGALHEVFHWIFEGLFRLWKFRLFYYGIIAAVLAIAVRNAVTHPPVQAHPVISMILDVSIAINFVRMGIIGLFIALERLLEMDYERHAYSIVIGFGISAIGSLIGFLTFSGFGPKVISLARNAPAVAYIIGLAVWVAGFIRPEPEGKEWKPPMSPEQLLEEVQGYLRALGIFGRRR